MGELRIENIRVESARGSRTLRADFFLGRRKRPLWFRTDDDGPVSTTADAFLPVALIPAMRRDWTVILDGDVSAQLLAGTDRIQKTMVRWFGHFHPVSLRVT